MAKGDHNVTLFVWDSGRGGGRLLVNGITVGRGGGRDRDRDPAIGRGCTAGRPKGIIMSLLYRSDHIEDGHGGPAEDGPAAILTAHYGPDPGSWFGRRFTYSPDPNGRGHWIRDHNSGITYDIVSTEDPAVFDLLVFSRHGHEDHIIAQYSGSPRAIAWAMLDNSQTWIRLYGRAGGPRAARAAARRDQLARGPRPLFDNGSGYVWDPAAEDGHEGITMAAILAEDGQRGS